jgi:hypothetical protein
MSCGNPPFTPTDCSGNGICGFSLKYLGHNVCTCNSGYSGKSDFGITTDDTDCHISIPAIQALWGINLILCCILVPLGIPALRQINQIQQQRALARGGKFSIRDNKSMMAMLPYLCLGFPMQITLAIVKLVDPNVHVGVEWFPTILWWFLRLGFYGSLLTFQPTLVESLLKSQKSESVQALVRLNNRLSRLLFVFAISIQFVSIYSVVSTPVDPFNPVPGLLAVEFFYLGSFVALLLASIQAFFIRGKIETLLHGVTDSRALLVRSNLIMLQNQYGKVLAFQSLVGLLFGVIPILFSKHDYYLPIATCAFPFTFFRTAYTLLNITKSPAGQDPITKASGGGGQVANGGNNPNTPNNQGGGGGGGTVVVEHRRNKDETAIGTLDATSVVQVDEDAPQLLARGADWKKGEIEEEPSPVHWKNAEKGYL